MRLNAFLIASLLTLSGSAVAQTPAVPSLARAKALYASAAYEEALAVLPERPVAVERDSVEQYRALCLIGLGRTADAARAFDRLLALNPSFRLSESDASPPVLELFLSVRRRALQERAESLYAQAKADLQDQRYADASRRFAEVVGIVDDPDLASVDRMLDLGLVAEEFHQLAEERRASGPAGRVTSAGAAPAATAPTNTARPTGTDVVYTMLDAAVKPPVEKSRVMPPWNPPRDLAWRTFRGVIEVVVGLDGSVERAAMVETLAPFYDTALVEAAHKWQFRPAERDGKPVRFRHLITILQRP